MRTPCLLLTLAFAFWSLPSDAKEECVFSTLSGAYPLALAHRGASGYRPEHTLEAYQMAMEIGADFVEPDLVATKDGVLVARHEPNIIDTTDVKSRPEFASRRKTKRVDGESMDGFFVEDFTLAEIKTLRAVQSHPYRDQTYNGLFEIPTFEEVILLVKRFEKTHKRAVGIYPETKHPSYFRSLGLPLEEKLLQTLKQHTFTDPKRVFIQSFEVSNLRDTLPKLMKQKGIRLPLMQLYGDFSDRPHDFVLSGNTQTYGDLAEKTFLKSTVSSYASGIALWKDSIILKEKITPKIDIDGNGTLDAGQRLTGVVRPLIALAHEAKLQVHVYTLRNEERFGTQGYTSVLEEEKELIRLGVDGIFSDFPDSIGFAVKEFCASQKTQALKSRK